MYFQEISDDIKVVKPKSASGEVGEPESHLGGIFKLNDSRCGPRNPPSSEETLIPPKPLARADSPIPQAQSCHFQKTLLSNALQNPVLGSQFFLSLSVPALFLGSVPAGQVMRAEPGLVLVVWRSQLGVAGSQ